MKRPVLTLTLFSLSAGLLLSSALPARAGLWGSDTPAAADETTGDATAVAASKWRSKRFTKYDANSDDSVSKDEYLKNVLEDFVRRDKDKSGDLSADEIDFPNETSPERLVEMRKRMQEDEIRDQKMRTEMEKRMKENEEKRKVEMERRAADDAKKAAEPVKEPEAKKEAVEEAAKEAVKEVVKDAAPAAATAPAGSTATVPTPTAPTAPTAPAAPVVKKP